MKLDVADACDFRRPKKLALGKKKRVMPKQVSDPVADNPIYSVWSGIKARCKPDGHARYGKRGIRMCARWLKTSPPGQGFRNFLEDMGPRPTEDHSIDRTNWKKNYTPSNCEWRTDIEQQRNRCNNVHLTIDGKRGTVSFWAEESGRHYSTVYARHRAGKSDYDAVYGDLSRDTSKVDNETRGEIADRLGVCSTKLGRKLKAGMTVTEIEEELAEVRARRLFIMNIGGVEKPAKWWCELLGIRYGMVYARSRSREWADEPALLTPARSEGPGSPPKGEFAKPGASTLGGKALKKAVAAAVKKARKAMKAGR